MKFGIYDGGLDMKKIMLGIALILFAILFQLCSSGMGWCALFVGLIGILLALCGCITGENNK